MEGWTKVWLEYDSEVAIMAFSNNISVPWIRRNYSVNSLHVQIPPIFHCSHIYRKENECADNYGHSIQGIQRWSICSTFIINEFFRDIYFTSKLSVFLDFFFLLLFLFFSFFLFRPLFLTKAWSPICIFSFFFFYIILGE